MQNILALKHPQNLFFSMSKASILVVDDEPAVLKVLVTRLQLAGYQVHQATNGEEAIEAFHKESPDSIVLDVMLPKMDGFAVCRRIRAESVVPIIFLTALEAISERVAGLDLGADDYLSGSRREIVYYLKELKENNNELYKKEAADFCKIYKISIYNLEKTIQLINDGEILSPDGTVQIEGKLLKNYSVK